MSDASPSTYAPPPEQVRQYQQLLKAAGLYDGEISGVWDAATWEALIAFQQREGISESGQIDAATTARVSRIGSYLSGQQVDPVVEQVRKRYGAGMVAYLDHDELGPLLRRAAAEKWDRTVFEGHLQQTQWWLRNQDSAQQWDTLTIERPAEANAQRRERMVYLTQQVGTMGIRMDDQLIRQLAEDSLRSGLSTGEIRGLLASFATFDPANGPQGEIAAHVQALRDTARRLYLRPSDAELFDRAKRIIAGELTLDGAIATYRMQAKANHPFLAEALDQGGTVEDYFAEHKRIIADALERSEDEVDLMNDRRLWPVMGFADGKGKQRPMTRSETIRFVNRNFTEDVDKTARLNENAAEFAMLIDQTMRPR